MKKLFTILIISISTLFLMSGTSLAEGEWATSDDNIYNTNSGNVGIGTTNPSALLHIQDGLLKIQRTSAIPAAIQFNNTNLQDFSAGDRVGGIVVTSNLNGDEGKTLPLSFIWTILEDATTDLSNTSGALIFGTTAPGPSRGERMRITSTGNVGIGTSSPAEKLEVSGNIRIANGGYIDTGIATNYSIYIGDTSTTTQYGGVYLKAPLDGSKGFLAYPRDEAGSISHYGLFTYRDNINAATIGTASDPSSLIVNTSGNVGIGTTSPQSKLAVNGTITTKEVNVTETGWSDFVFEDNYPLPSLDHVETFIKENNHLPDIPSAQEVKEEGLPVSEMMAKQMQKIEELTLYLIEMKKELAELRKKVN